ncbi:MAG: DegT/DnrJ/EryC1/StrS family aminotransferase [Proteobacteria bacterium]|nr:DegT/DnrJ/EryC1/StrS family aminotransferase [Pseudomonadota bacterium]
MRTPGPQKIKLADPCLTEAEERAAVEVLRSGRVVAGPRVEELETRLARITGRAHAVALSSGTAALLALLHELGIGVGKTVVVPALAFPAAAQAAAFLGARVVACDVEPTTLNASAQTIAAVLEREGGADLVVAVDLFGVPAEAPGIAELLEPRGIRFVVDAACSLGASLDGRPCGAFGDAAILSFHPRKLVTTGEGGAVLTDNAGLAATLRRFRNVGAEGGAFHGVGLNLRPSEIGAAIGCVQLARLDEIISRRAALASRYGALPLGFQAAPPGARRNHQTFAALLPERLGRSGRDGLVAHLAARGIEAQVASHCLGTCGPLAAALGAEADATPAARAAADLGLALPLHGGLSFEDVDRIAADVRDWLERHGVTG